jgi:hypothetical protein
MNSPGGPWRWRLFPESLCDSNCESDALDNEYASHSGSWRLRLPAEAGASVSMPQPTAAPKMSGLCRLL